MGEGPVSDRRLGWIAAALSALLTVVIVVGMLWYCRDGFSFDDEGFAMVWISTPGLYSGSVTEFGFLYHPIFSLLGNDIALFRQVILFSLFVSGWALFDIVLRRYLPFGPRMRLPRIAASAGLAASALTWYGMWLLAPSYNTLELQSIIIIAIGVVLFDDDSPRKVTAGAVLIGVGGWLAFLAKPTSAAAAAVIVLAWIVVARRFRIRPILLAGAVAAGLIVASAFVIDGSLGGFVDRLRIGSDLVTKLDAGHSLAQAFRLEKYNPGQRLFLATILVAVLLVLVSLALQATTLAARLAWVASAVVVAVVGGLIVRGHVQELLVVNIFHASLLLAIPAAALVIAVVCNGIGAMRSIPLGQWALGLGFLLFPYAYAFGTNTSYWRSGGAAALFWVLGGLILLVPLRGRPRLPALVLSFALVTQVLVGTMLVVGSRTPYRQPKVVGEKTISTIMGANGSTLNLAPDVSRYINQSTSESRSAGFREGMPMIDLTGKSPGTLFVLGAKSIGQPWTLGSYPGSARVAAIALDVVPCRQVGSAWLLVEPNGPRSISPTILADYGADLAKDYTIAASWKTAKGMGGYRTTQTQQLMKPTRTADVAAQACATARGSR